MQTHKLAGSHAMGKGKVSVWDFSARKLNKPFPSQNKAFHTERGCSGAAVKAAAWSGAVPAVVNWNVLETVPPPPHSTALAAMVLSANMDPRLFPEYCLIWLCGRQWTGLLGCRAYQSTGALRFARLLMSRPGTRGQDGGLAAGPQHQLRGRQLQASSLPAKWGAVQFEKSADRAPNTDEAGGEGAWQSVAGKNPLTIMPAPTSLRCPPSPACGWPVQQPWAPSPGSSPSSTHPWPCWLSRTSCGARQWAEWGPACKG